MNTILGLILLSFSFSCNSSSTEKEIRNCVVNEVQSNQELISYSTSDSILLRELSTTLSTKKQVEERKYIHKYRIDIFFNDSSRLHIETTGMVFKEKDKYYECNLLPILEKIKHSNIVK